MGTCRLVVAAAAAIAVGATTTSVRAQPKPAPPPAPAATPARAPAPAPSEPPRRCHGSHECLEEAVAALKANDFDAAIYPLHEVCVLQMGWGCATLADRYERGEGVTTNAENAASLYGYACDLGSGYGCFRLATYRWIGIAGPNDSVEALRLMKQACKYKYAGACDQAGEYQAAVDAQAAAVAERQCARGELGGCAAQVATLLGTDDKRALAIATKACKGNHLRSCALQGIAMSRVRARGWQGKAMKLWQRACDGGDVVGCRELGTAYHDGLVGKADPVKAWAAFERACAGTAPDLPGCNRGAAAANGEGRFDREIALGRIACDQGDGGGCDHVGIGLQNAGDFRNAYVAYDKACDGGVLHACTVLEGWFSGSDPVPTIGLAPGRAAEYRYKIRELAATAAASP